MAKTDKEKIQQFQNGTLRQYTRNQVEDTDLTIQDLHDKYNIETINTRMFRRANKTWDKLRTLNVELTERSLQQDQNEQRDHYWWRRISPFVNGEQPEPWYMN